MPGGDFVGGDARGSGPGGFAEATVTQDWPPLTHLLGDLGALRAAETIGLADQDRGLGFAEFAGAHSAQHLRQILGQDEGLVHEPLTGDGVPPPGERHPGTGEPPCLSRSVCLPAEAGSGGVDGLRGQLDLPGTDRVVQHLQFLDQQLVDLGRNTLSCSAVHLGLPGSNQ